MTRINVVSVMELSDAHLETEHYEIVRVYALVRKVIARGEQPDLTAIPTYRMGEGHVRFFYPRLGYVRSRELDINIEMLIRNLTLIREIEDISDIPQIWFGKYQPDNEARFINKQRLNLRKEDYNRVMSRGYVMEKPS